jgi:hypothetical protein
LIIFPVGHSPSRPLPSAGIPQSRHFPNRPILPVGHSPQSAFRQSAFP